MECYCRKGVQELNVNQAKYKYCGTKRHSLLSKAVLVKGMLVCPPCKFLSLLQYLRYLYLITRNLKWLFNLHAKKAHRDLSKCGFKKKKRVTCCQKENSWIKIKKKIFNVNFNSDFLRRFYIHGKIAVCTVCSRLWGRERNLCLSELQNK